MMAVFRTCLRTRNARSPGKVLSLSLSRPPPIEMRDMFFFFDPSGARGETAGRSPRGGPRVGPRTDRCIKWRDPPVEVDVRRASCPLPVRPPSRISARYFSGALGAPPRARTAPPPHAAAVPLHLAPCDTATWGSEHRARGAFRAALVRA